MLYSGVHIDFTILDFNIGIQICCPLTHECQQEGFVWIAKVLEKSLGQVAE